MEEELADGKLVIPWPHAMPSTNAYYLAYPEHSAEVPKVRLFVKWMLEQIDSPDIPA
ncbi:DNA-binding transcriptional activator GcvA [compost metagenome]